MVAESIVVVAVAALVVRVARELTCLLGWYWAERARVRTLRALLRRAGSGAWLIEQRAGGSLVVRTGAAHRHGGQCGG